MIPIVLILFLCHMECQQYLIYALFYTESWQKDLNVWWKYTKCSFSSAVRPMSEYLRKCCGKIKYAVKFTVTKSAICGC